MSLNQTIKRLDRLINDRVYWDGRIGHNTLFPIYVDVDDTLIFWKPGSKKGEAEDCLGYNELLCKLLRRLHATGKAEIILWSGAGARHAEDVAKEAGITDIVKAYLTKPLIFVDDLGGELEWAIKEDPMDANKSLSLLVDKLEGNALNELRELGKSK